MRVVADTSPICYLLLIGSSELLPSLFQRIFIPEAVARELAHADAAPVLRHWIASPPAWLQIRAVPENLSSPQDRLHPGEREALALAELIAADLILLDERKARQVAVERGLSVTGLLGILLHAAERGLLSLPEALSRLQATNFRADPNLIQTLLKKAPTP
jgi:predicted nucleic acid-binding protein